MGIPHKQGQSLSDTMKETDLDNGVTAGVGCFLILGAPPVFVILSSLLDTSPGVKSEWPWYALLLLLPGIPSIMLGISVAKRSTKGIISSIAFAIGVLALYVILYYMTNQYG